MKSSIDCIIFFSGKVSNIMFIHQKFILLRVNFQSSAERVASCASCVIELTFGVCCSAWPEKLNMNQLNHLHLIFYRTRVRSLAMLVSDCCLVNLMALNDTNCLMMSQELLKVFLRRKKLCKMVGTLLNQKLLVRTSYILVRCLSVSQPTPLNLGEVIEPRTYCIYRTRVRSLGMLVTN